MRTIHRDIVGAFIFSADDKLLLGHSGVYSGAWVVPGGGVDKGETYEQALIREIREETGIDLTNETVEPLHSNQVGESEKVLRETGERVLVKMKFNDYRVNLRADSSQVQLVADDDFLNPRWFSREELNRLHMSEPTTRVLEKMGVIEKRNHDE